VGVIFIDPSLHGLDDPAQYTPWDLLGIETCDVVFAYMEEDNPSGYGLSLEVGYARALGKLVILVDAKMDDRMAIVRATANIVLNSLDEGRAFLCSLKSLYE
jgi:nucleoside 2-deoxyribosyltransferase